MSLRIVFDTNVLLSAVLNKNSVPDQAFRRATEIGTILVSLEMLRELVDVLNREKLDRFIPLQERILFLANLANIAIENKPTVTITACPDEKDNKFLELAVSGDDDLLVFHPFEGIDIVTPAAFLEKYSEETDHDG